MEDFRSDVCIVFDNPTDIQVRGDGTDSLFEMMSHASVQSIIKALDELGFSAPDIVSSKKLYEMLSNDTPPSYRLGINLSSGLVDRWRYAQGPMALELLRLPYSGSDLFTILVCRDKQRAKQLCPASVTVPKGLVVKSSDVERLKYLDQSMFPVIIKPNGEGGSVGLDHETVPVTHVEDAYIRANELITSFPEGVLVEQFIPGAEATTVVIGNGSSRKVFPFAFAFKDKAPLPPDFVRTQSEKADAFKTGKRAWFEATEIHNPIISDQLVDATNVIADSLGLLDLARLDFRISEKGEVYFIEANAQPTFVQGNTSLTKCSEVHFNDPLGVEKAYINSALIRTR